MVSRWLIALNVLILVTITLVIHFFDISEKNIYYLFLLFLYLIFLDYELFLNRLEGLSFLG